jgi:glucose/arabinose dehydrogenase
LPDGRLLVGELTGPVWVVQPGASQPDPVPLLDLGSAQLFGEQGLMDIELDPNFAHTGHLHVFYTKGFPGAHKRDRVSRFTMSGAAIAPGSEVVLWQDNVDAHAEHHGGALGFGPDGRLYISVGDHFNAADAQRLDSYHGKILRINANGSIPTDNPFHDGNGPNREEIWALGLRNPFRMSFDRVTGRLFIGDVGGNDPATAFEEVNLGARSANYGWPLGEGQCPIAGVTSPIHAYTHNGRDASITGGFVYQGTQFPSEYQGNYFFADYVQNWFKRLVPDDDGNVLAVIPFEPPSGSPDGPYGDPVKLIEGPEGSLYYVDIGFNDQHVPNEATIRRIRFVLANQPPSVVATAAPTRGLPPLTVSFSSQGTTDPEGQPLTYTWTFGYGAKSSVPDPTHTYAAAGQYTAFLSVSDGASTTLSSLTTIVVGDAPTPVILSPPNGRTFVAGEAIGFEGFATDVEDGSLSPEAFSWTVVFHHDTHVHPALGPLTGTTTGSLQIPTSGHDFQGSTSYEIILSV